MKSEPQDYSEWSFPQLQPRLAGLEIDWPERVDAALRERLEKLDAAGAKAWAAEIGAEMEKLADQAAV